MELSRLILKLSWWKLMRNQSGLASKTPTSRQRQDISRVYLAWLVFARQVSVSINEAWRAAGSPVEFGAWWRVSPQTRPTLTSRPIRGSAAAIPHRERNAAYRAKRIMGGAATMNSTQHDRDAESEQDDQSLHASLDQEAVDVVIKLDEASPLRDQLTVFKKSLGLRDRELVNLSGVSRATLARWGKDGDAERPPALDDLRAIAALLIRTGAMRPRSVAGWLRSRNVGLRDQRPLEVLAAGDFSRVLKVAEDACGSRQPVPQLDNSNERRSFIDTAATADGLAEAPE